jgi:ComF family protein
MNTLAGLARRSGKVVLDLLLPPHCACCEGPVGQAGQLCAGCFGKIGFVSDPCCLRCGRPFGYGQTDAGRKACAACLADPPAWSRARAAMVYDEHARRLILPLKHGDRTENARVLGFHMARAGAAVLAEADWLVPVPLHRLRLLRRRYNQAALLAQDLSRRSGVPALPDGLRRVRPTAMLADLSASRRAAELEGSIAVREARREQIAGRRILLIDDVLTSGATAGACARALLAGGALGVDVLVACRVPAPGDG